jgi:hypothetical protein
MSSLVNATAILAASVMLLSACGKETKAKSEDDSAESKKKEKKKKKKKKEAPSGSTSPAASKATAADCKADKELAIVYKSPFGPDKGLPDSDGMVETATAWALTSVPGSYNLFLANWKMEDEKFPVPRGDKYKDEYIYFMATVSNGDSSKPLELTAYGKKDDKDHKLSPGVYHKGGSIFFSSMKGQMDIVYVDDDKLCGFIDVKGDYLSVKGNFTADVKKR